MEVHDNILHFCCAHLRKENYSIDQANIHISIKRLAAGSQMSLSTSLFFNFFVVVIIFNLPKTQMAKYFLEATVPVVQPPLLQPLWEHKNEHDLPKQISVSLSGER